MLPIHRVYLRNCLANEDGLLSGFCEEMLIKETAKRFAESELMPRVRLIAALCVTFFLNLCAAYLCSTSVHGRPMETCFQMC